VGGQGTRATQRLAALGIAYRVHQYAHDQRASSYGVEAAAAMGVPAERVFKTLIASVDGQLTVAVVPVSGQLNLKALADAAGGKKAEMAQTAAAERATGYVTGGISPIAQRKVLLVVIDSSATSFETVFCSAGQRGLEVELAPDDLVLATGATLASIARPGSLSAPAIGWVGPSIGPHVGPGQPSGRRVSSTVAELGQVSASQSRLPALRVLSGAPVLCGPLNRALQTAFGALFLLLPTGIVMTGFPGRPSGGREMPGSRPEPGTVSSGV
jgi:Cys-tRNA(Pro)/Cys-tRNA(Cys) deacylase